MRAIAFATLLFGAAVLLAVTPSASGVSIVNQRRNAQKALDALEAGAAVSTIGAYIAPLVSDCRGPCPALNTLANHGVLPHDGRNIDVNLLKNALINVIGLDTTFGNIFVKAALDKFADPATQKISLCDVLTNIHNTDQPSKKTGIEHSASMSREDRPNGDFSHATDNTQRSPSPAQVAIVIGSSSDGKMLTTRDFVTARGKLWQKSYANQPALHSDSVDGQTHIIASVEGCLLLGALSGNSNNGGYQVSTAYAQSFLQSEQFPNGWVKSARPMGIAGVLQCLAGQGFAWAENEVTGLVELAKHWFGVQQQVL